MDSTTLNAFLRDLVYQVIIPMLAAGFIAGFVLRGRRAALLTAIEHGFVSMLLLFGIATASIWLTLSVKHSFAKHGLFGSAAGLAAIFLLFSVGSLIGALVNRWRERQT